MKTPGKLLFVLGLGASAASALPLRAQEHVVFALPLACEAHKTCFIQSYVDTDPGPAVKDYACGAASYDENNGVDFRLLSAEAARVGVPVLAAAAGKVKATRDGMTDQFLRAAKPGDVKGRECGNGVVIEHGDGWETQYCHLMKGSIPVSKGQAVGKGEKLGFVGYSGMADFAHLHFVVRHNGQVIDPFAPEAGPGACAAAGKPVTLWEPAVPAAFGYRNGEIIATGFTSVPPNPEKLEENHTAVEPLNALSPAMLFYARFINLVSGDRVRMVINGPGGALIEQLSEPLETNKDTYFTFAGKKRREAPWQQGRYEARAEIVRDGAVAAAAVNQVDIPPVAATKAAGR